MPKPNKAFFTARHRQITEIDEAITKGIDHVYSKEGPPKITLIAESKYNTGRLRKLKSDPTIKQMDERWIEARLMDVIGEDEAYRIIEEGYSAVVAKIKPDGTITYKLLDQDARTIGEFTP